MKQLLQSCVNTKLSRAVCLNFGFIENGDELTTKDSEIDKQAYAQENLRNARR
jgi:hypothetical protein